MTHPIWAVTVGPRSAWDTQPKRTNLHHSVHAGFAGAPARLGWPGPEVGAPGGILPPPAGLQNLDLHALAGGDVAAVDFQVREGLGVEHRRQHV